MVALFYGILGCKPQGKTFGMCGTANELSFFPEDTLNKETDRGARPGFHKLNINIQKFTKKYPIWKKYFLGNNKIGKKNIFSWIRRTIPT